MWRLRRIPIPASPGVPIVLLARVLDGRLFAGVTDGGLFAGSRCSLLVLVRIAAAR